MRISWKNGQMIKEDDMKRLKDAVREATKEPEKVEIDTLGFQYADHSEVDEAMKHLGEKYDYVSRRPSMDELWRWHRECMENHVADAMDRSEPPGCSAEESALVRVAQMVVGRLYEEADTYGGAKQIMQEWLEEYRRDIERLEDEATAE